MIGPERNKIQELLDKKQDHSDKLDQLVKRLEKSIQKIDMGKLLDTNSVVKFEKERDEFRGKLTQIAERTCDSKQQKSDLKHKINGLKAEKEGKGMDLNQRKKGITDLQKKVELRQKHITELTQNKDMLE